MKNKTNRQILTKAIKELSNIELAFLRERILQACDDVLENEDEVRKLMERHIISPDLYIDTMRNIKSKIEFEGI
jgi:Xaa-Pro aminopeptidase